MESQKNVCQPLAFVQVEEKRLHNPRYEKLGCSRRQKIWAVLLHAAIVFLLVGSTHMSYAQSGATSTLVGNVADTSGAAVSGANVTIENVGTNLSQATVTSGSGTYNVPSLKPGNYRVIVTAPGFDTQVVNAVVLAVGQESRVNVSLHPGKVSQTLNVNAQAVNLDTENAAIGQIITQKQVVDLPLNGRNFTQLLLLNSGAVQNTGEQGVYRANEGNALSIQGARPSSNQYFLDGININESYYQVPAIIPSIDALQEFQEQTKGYSAAYGGGANQINLSTKSGTNAIHGTAFDFLRNNALDARNYFNTGLVAPLKQNQFGYTLGGPIVIPKLYNGKDKSFFFANYEGQRTSTSVSSFATVPTVAEKSGLFPRTIVDPITKIPYLGNQIPAGKFSAFGTAALSHFPDPNTSRPQGNYQYLIALPTNADQQTYRIDQKISSKDTAFARYTQTEYTPTTRSGGGSFDEGKSHLDEVSHQIVGNWTRVFTPNVVNQAVFGRMTETVNLSGIPTSQADFSATGLQNLYPFNSQTVFPNIQFRNGQYSGAGGASYSPQHFDQTAYEATDTLTFNKGTHSLSMGADVRWWVWSNYNFNSPIFIFDGSYTGAPKAGGGTVAGTGDPLADMIVGYAAQAQAQQPTGLAPTIPDLAVRLHNRYVAPWIQDDWKATSRLTINAGLRYDFSIRPFEENNKRSWLDPNIPGGGVYTANQQILAQGLGGNLYQYGGDRAPGNTQWLVFAPRVGFAYRLTADGKTVLRGGYGVFFDSTESKEASSAGGYPFGQNTILQFVNITGLFPPAPGLKPATKANLTSFFFSPSVVKTPYMQDWQLSVEREVLPGFKAEVDYLGSKGTHLLGRILPNQPTQYDPAHPSPASARLPYPNFGTIYGHSFDFYSNYNALTAKLEHAGRNLTFLASYTYSHSLDDKSGTTGINADSDYNGPMNEYNFNEDYGNSSFDLRHHFVANAMTELPFGRGQHFLGNANTVENLLVGGWQLNGILSWQTGFPFTVSAVDIGYLNQNGAQRADVVGKPYPAGFHKSINQWFNTAAFGQPTIGAFGNSARNLLRGPGYVNLDASIFKNIPIAGRVTWQTRLEAFNSLNHPNFGLPTASITSPTNGVISSAQPGRILQVAMKLIW